MAELNSDNKRIAKNTAYMYIRMFVTMLIGLYTSRAVLSALGFEDYGLYNVVGGIIALFAFVNSAMTNTTSRYITFFLGKKDTRRLREVFSTAFYIHVFVAIIIIILGETIGLWYVCNKLVVPEGRLSATLWLYQFTIITAAANIISVPFNSSIIANERMSAYAVIAIIDSVFKLFVAISLKYISFDKLVYYGLMILLIQLTINAIYWIYNYRNFEGSRIKNVFDRTLFKEMFGFTGWNLFGSFINMFFNQGINLILNFFCGPTVNAARGISVQVEGLVRTFATNVQTAINPQIIKSYAEGQRERFFTLIFSSSRFCFYLLFMIALPIILEADFLLTLWLGNYPEHTVNFIRITLISVTLESLVTPMFMANLASGKVKIYQTVISIISAVFIPVTYISMKYTLLPESVFVCLLTVRIIEIIARIFIVHHQVGLPRKLYITKVLFNVIAVALCSTIIPVIVHTRFDESGWLRFLIVGSVSVLSVAIVSYYIGANRQEREFVKLYIAGRIKRKQ